MDQVDLMDIDLENSNQSALSNDALVTEDSVAGKSTPTLKVGYRLFAKMQGKDEMGLFLLYVFLYIIILVFSNGGNKSDRADLRKSSDIQILYPFRGL